MQGIVGLMSYSSGRLLRALATVLLSSFILFSAACGGSGSPTFAPPTSANGNWQFNLVQNYPSPSTTLSISGFLVEASSGDLTGSLQVPALGKDINCAGASIAAGTISGEDVNFLLNVFGTEISFTGTVSSDGSSMSGSYQAPAGACYNKATTGTWTASLVPPLTGTFTGTLLSEYMETLTGASSPVAVPVSGTMTQSDSAGASNATLAGTITAAGYPCFATATMTGTISGQNVYLSFYGYNGEQIGTLGTPPPAAGGSAFPATVVVAPGELSLVGAPADSNGLVLGVISEIGETGPCPPILLPNGNSLVVDNDSITLNF
jgi:hypothetical protein